MQIGGLEVVIGASGLGGATSALKAVDKAGAQTNAALEAGAKRTAARISESYSEMGRNYLRAMASMSKQGRQSAEQAGADAANALVAGLEQQFARRQAEIKEELARGFLTPAEAEAEGREAAKAFNAGVLSTIERVGAAGGFAAGQGTPTADQPGPAGYVALAGKLKDVGDAAGGAATGGVRSLIRSLSSLAATELGVRGGLGSMTGVLAQMALGATVTLGVVAGLAAIAYGFRKLEEAAERARQRVKDSQDALKEASEARAAQLAEANPLAAAKIKTDDATRAETEATNELATATAKLAIARRNERLANAVPGGSGLAAAIMHRLTTNALNNRIAAENNLAAAQQKRITAEAEARKLEKEALSTALAGLVEQNRATPALREQALAWAEVYRQEALTAQAARDFPAAAEAWQRYGQIISGVATVAATAAMATRAQSEALKELTRNTRLLTTLTDRGRGAFEQLRGSQEDEQAVTALGVDLWTRYAATLSESTTKHLAFEDALAQGNAKAREFQRLAAGVVASRRALSSGLAREGLAERLSSAEREAAIASAEATGRLAVAQRLQHETRMAALRRELDAIAELQPAERQRILDAAEAVFAANQEGQRTAALISLRQAEASAAAAAAEAAGQYAEADAIARAERRAALEDELTRTVGLTEAEKERRRAAFEAGEDAIIASDRRNVLLQLDQAEFDASLRSLRINGQANEADRQAAERRIELLIVELKAKKLINDEEERRLRLLLQQAAAPLTDHEAAIQSLSEQINRMQSMGAILQELGDAWLMFWQSVGSGEGVEGSLKKVLAGMAAYLARWAMANALLNIAKGIGGDPRGFAAAAAYMAAAAALSAFAGAMGGGSGGGGGSNAYDATVKDREAEYRLPVGPPRRPGWSPLLQPGGASATAMAAGTLRPPAPVVVNQTIIGPNDPVAQRQIAALTQTAARRGYAVGGR